eukprot:3581228-Prymnesium_polylepis.1
MLRLRGGGCCGSKAAPDDDNPFRGKPVAAPAAATLATDASGGNPFRAPPPALPAVTAASGDENPFRGSSALALAGAPSAEAGSTLAGGNLPMPPANPFRSESTAS